jgi:UDPglucose 6-dehydrogenase
MRKIGIIGCGYVGLATALTFSKLGHEVICGDIDESKVALLNEGLSPVAEPGFGETLKELTETNKLTAMTDIKGLASESAIIFICVGTPSNPDGSIDLSAIEGAARSIAGNLNGQVVVVKSTVLPGTARDVVLKVLEGAGGDFTLCNNPEFLREGSALEDSLNPDRIIIGSIDEKGADALLDLYETFDCPKLVTDLETTEMIKYASNIFLALKVTYANEMANLCERFGVDVYEVMEGVKLDKRIAPKFLEAGAGFGGSCFEKDLSAMIAGAKAKGVYPSLVATTLDINDTQPLRTVELLEKAVGDVSGKDIAVLGLAFKEGTADVRNSRAIIIVQALLAKGANVTVYDPLAMNNFKALDLGDITFADNLDGALTGKDAVIIQTRSDEYKRLEPGDFKGKMRKPVVIDGRRAFDPEVMTSAGITYLGIGWKNRK